MKRCPICGAKIDDGLETCPYCGEIISVGRAKTAWAELTGKDRQEAEQKEVNPNKQTYYIDGSAQQPQQPMEPTQGPKKKSKAGLISAILIVIFIVAVGLYVAFGNDSDNPNGPVVVDDAYDAAIDFFNTVYDDAVILEEAGISVADAWYDALESGETEENVKAAIDQAFAGYKDDLDNVTVNQANISYLYAQAVSMADDVGQSDLADAVEEMYNRYFDFLETVMDTDRSYDDYAMSFNDADDNLYYAMQALYDILPE